MASACLLLADSLEGSNALRLQEPFHVRANAPNVQNPHLTLPFVAFTVGRLDQGASALQLLRPGLKPRQLQSQRSSPEESGVQLSTEALEELMSIPA